MSDSGVRMGSESEEDRAFVEDMLEGVPESPNESILREKITKFRRACRQIVLLNNQLSDLWIRYQRADKRNRRSFRYTTRLRLCTLEGVRDRFYEFMTREQSEIQRLSNSVVAELTQTYQTMSTTETGSQ